MAATVDATAQGFRNSGNLALLARKSGIPDIDSVKFHLGKKNRTANPFKSKFQGEIDALSLYPIEEGGTRIRRQGRFAGRRNAAQSQADARIKPRVKR